MTCSTLLLVLVGGVFLMATLMRWFEQTAEAVDNGWWNKVTVLVAVPFAVWFYPSRVSAGRPVPVPLHVPVAGMGAAPKVKPTPVAAEAPPAAPTGASAAPAPRRAKPRPAAGAGSGADPELVEKLRKKMREQGMLPPDDAP